MPSEVAKEMTKLVSDLLNYEKASNPDNKVLALGADLFIFSLADARDDKTLLKRKKRR